MVSLVIPAESCIPTMTAEIFKSKYFLEQGRICIIFYNLTSEITVSLLLYCFVFGKTILEAHSVLRGGDIDYIIGRNDVR